MKTTAPVRHKSRAALRRIDSFRQRFGDGHFYLACHAALPLALTPDLLYCLWANFQRDVQGAEIGVPWIAVADLMLSNLCKEVGNELYELDGAVRDELLSQLQQDDRFGLERVRELADFVMAYVEQELEHPDLDVRDLAQTQKLRALVYRQPNAAAHEIAVILTQLPLQDKTEWIRMATLLTSLAEPLSVFPALLDYIRAMADWARGNLEAATAQMAKAMDVNQEVRVEGVNLPIPEVINGRPPKSAEPEAPPPRRSNKLNWPIAIAGSTIVSLLMIAGIQYALRSPNPQRSPDVTSSVPPSPQNSPSPSPRTIPLSPASPSASPSVQSTPSSSLPPANPSPSGTLLPQSGTPSPNPQGSQSSPSPTTTASSSPSSTPTLPSPSSTTTDPVQAIPLPVTFEQIMQIAPDANPERARLFLPYLNQTMAEFGINTRLRQAHFLAQAMHESDRLSSLEEDDISGQQYEFREDLGNTQPGDGVKFKSRGLLKITGRANYANVGKALGVDLIKNPRRLADPDLAFRSTGWYWDSRKLNSDADLDDVSTITRIINGGYHGFDDRKKLLQAAKKALGI